MKNKIYHSVRTVRKSKRKIVEIKRKTKNATLSEQFQNPIEKQKQKQNQYP